MFHKPIQLIRKTMTKKSDRLFFLCTGETLSEDGVARYQESHIIGELVRILDGTIVVTALALYEVSLTVSTPPHVLPPVRLEIIGDSRKIKCTCCKHHARWIIGKAAIRSVIQKYVAE